MDEIDSPIVKIKNQFRRFSIDDLDLKKHQLSFTDQYQINVNLQNANILSEVNSQCNTLAQSMCILEPSPCTTSFSSTCYLKPYCLSTKPIYTTSEKNIFHLLDDDSYSNLIPLKIGDDELYYKPLPPEKVMDIASLYFRNNPSPSILDIEEIQSPKEKRIARVVMVVSILLLTMSVVLVGVMLSMSGYIDSMVRELYSKKHQNTNNFAFGNAMLSGNLSQNNQSLFSYPHNNTSQQVVEETNK